MKSGQTVVDSGEPLRVRGLSALFNLEAALAAETERRIRLLR